MPAAIDLTGHRFGRLVAVESAGKSSNGHAWKCVCDCGNAKTASVRSLRSGNTKSCGCLQPEIAARMRRKHGEGSAINRVPEYVAWQRMRARCNDQGCKDFPDYGGRGVRVCDRWNQYENFLADMGRKPSPSHSIDRVDVNGIYEPGNVKWSTPSEQARNKRGSLRFEHNGITKPLAAWADDLGVKYMRLYKRVVIRKQSISIAMEAIRASAP